MNSGRIQSSNLVKEDSQDAIVSCSICDRYTRTAVDVCVLVGKRVPLVAPIRRSNRCRRQRTPATDQRAGQENRLDERRNVSA